MTTVTQDKIRNFPLSCGCRLNDMTPAVDCYLITCKCGVSRFYLAKESGPLQYHWLLRNV